MYGVPMQNPEWMELLHQSLFRFSEFSNDRVLADSSCWVGNQKSRISSSRTEEILSRERVPSSPSLFLCLFDKESGSSAHALVL